MRAYVLICQRKIEEGSFDVTHNLHKHNAERLVYSNTLFPCVISAAIETVAARRERQAKQPPKYTFIKRRIWWKKDLYTHSACSTRNEIKNYMLIHMTWGNYFSLVY